MAIDRFTARALTANVRQMGDGRSNFLSNVIFRQGQIHPTDKIDFGVMKVLARVAKYRRPGEPALAVNKNSGDSKTVTAPKIRLKKVFDENFAATLNPALDSYMGPYTNPNEQLAEKVSTEQRELRMRIDRSVEVQCAQALATGEITITYEDGATATIDLGYTGDGTTAGATLTIQPALSGTKLWTSTSSKPWEDLEDLVAQIRDNSDYDGELAVLMGAAAWKAFYGNEKVQKDLDNRRINAGNMTPVAGALYKGEYNGLSIYQYSNGYVDDDGARQQAWPTNRIAVVPINSDVMTIEHAAVFDRPTPDAKQQFIQTDYFSKMVTHEDPPVDEVIVESRPLALIKSPDAIRVKDVVAAA